MSAGGGGEAGPLGEIIGFGRGEDGGRSPGGGGLLGEIGDLG